MASCGASFPPQVRSCGSQSAFTWVFSEYFHFFFCPTNRSTFIKHPISHGELSSLFMISLLCSQRSQNHTMGLSWLTFYLLSMLNLLGYSPKLNNIRHVCNISYNIHTCWRPIPFQIAHTQPSYRHPTETGTRWCLHPTKVTNYSQLPLLAN